MYQSKFWEGLRVVAAGCLENAQWLDERVSSTVIDPSGQ